MRVKSVLFPTDFSPLSQAALPYAVSLARDFGAELLIAHVIEPGAVYSFGDACFHGDAEPNYSSVKQMLAQIVPAGEGIRFRHVLLTGAPARSIVQLAEADEAGLIVMATHGVTGLKHLLLGSVAEHVVREARCPVLTFKPQRTAETTADLYSGLAKDEVRS
jgi:nucleotide-binding universal stress UspA family protein